MKRRNAWHLIVACGKFPVNSTVAAATGCCKQHSTAQTNQANCQMQAESSRAEPSGATLRDLLRTHNLRPVEQASGACPACNALWQRMFLLLLLFPAFNVVSIM